MSGTASLRPNPPLIILDSSVLLQVIATGQFQILRSLKSDFNIRSTVVPAVDAEVSCLIEQVPKFRGRREQYKKALRNNTLSLLDRDFLLPIYGSAVDSWIRQMETEGERLFAVVDRGEAFSHAASMVLNVPVATNDLSAVNRLVRGGESLPTPIIRFWDLVVLAHQTGKLSSAECDNIRQYLQKISERVAPCFEKSSFADGLPRFFPRLMAAGKPCLGATVAQDKHDRQLVLTPEQTNATSG